MNNCDLEHVSTTHPQMTEEEWRSVYRQAWDAYYSMEHLETLMRRATGNPRRIFEVALQFHGCYCYFRESDPPTARVLRRTTALSCQGSLAREVADLFVS